MNGNTVVFERSEYEAMEVDEQEATIKMKTKRVFSLGKTAKHLRTAPLLEAIDI